MTPPLSTFDFVYARPRPLAESAASATTELGPIGLAELNELAELHTRVDRKYIVDEHMLERLLADHRDLSVLEIDGRRQFAYESVYFDTEGFELHRAAATDRRRRFKVRTRLYADSGVTALEVKAKDGQARTVKHRLDYDTADRHRLTEVGREFVDFHAMAAGFAERLAPVLTTRYVRSTLVDVAGGSRSTFDSGLVCTDTDGSAVSLDRVIIETKSDGPAGPIDRWLWHHGVRPIKLSKYCTTLVQLRPELPSNKWHRTIHRYFR